MAEDDGAQRPGDEQDAVARLQGGAVKLPCKTSLSLLAGQYPHLVLVHRNALVNPSQMRMLEKQYTDEEGECWAMRLHSVPEMLQVSRRQLSAVRSVLQGTRRPEHQQTEPA